MLAKRGVFVTQATLSRDIKALKLTKVPHDPTGYMYVIPDSTEWHDTMVALGGTSQLSTQKLGYVSVDFSGSMVVIKTRNGYASGLAYDIDMSHCEEIIGTIAGADTVFAVLREGVTRAQALRALRRFIPIDEDGNPV